MLDQALMACAAHYPNIDTAPRLCCSVLFDDCFTTRLHGIVVKFSLKHITGDDFALADVCYADVTNVRMGCEFIKIDTISQSPRLPAMRSNCPLTMAAGRDYCPVLIAASGRRRNVGTRVPTLRHRIGYGGPDMHSNIVTAHGEFSINQCICSNTSANNAYI